MAKIKWQKAPEMLIWNKVKTLRKMKGLKQAQLAIGADISITTLWMIESGFDKKTTIETKRKLANYFQCDVDDIFPVEMVSNEPRKD